ncbi:hypothetical protein [Halodesulfovibrio sp. MK-HDV]|nr:hypothetical protein [Halodesulfovibrio sp. MK-HDV]KAF1077630.1 hypothetical protein MKHDV_00086 [Halodesulfovibrio sp. MK-HDV]
MNEYSEKQLPSTGFINRICMAGIMLLVFATYLSLGELLTEAI